MDIFYCDMIDKLVSKIECDWENLYTSYVENDNFDETAEAYKESIVNKFEETIKKEYESGKKENYFNSDFLNKIFPAYVKEHKELFSSSLLEDIAALKGCATMFIPYFNTRSTIIFGTKRNSVSYRLINDNFVTYADNIATYNRFHTEYSKEMETIKEQLHINDDYSNGSGYAGCLTKEGMTQYITFISGYTDGSNYTKGFNQTINEINQMNKSLKKDNGYHGYSFKRMSKLKKQILAEDETQFSIPIIANEEEFRMMFSEFENLMEKTSSIEKIIQLFVSINDYDAESIYVSGKSTTLAVISHMVTGQHDFF